MWRQVLWSFTDVKVRDKKKQGDVLGSFLKFLSFSTLTSSVLKNKVVFWVCENITPIVKNPYVANEGV